MIRPNKHSHPDKTIINVAYIILGYLYKKRLAKFDDLRDLIINKIYGENKKNEGEVLFLPALNFLYLLGLIIYRSKTDSFEIIQRK